MRVTKVEWLSLRIPFVKQFTTANSTMNNRYAFLIFIHTDRGLSGLGEASPIGAGTLEELGQLSDIMEALSPQFIGANLEDLKQLVPECTPNSELGNVLGSGLETALYDLMGKRGECSVASLIGGKVRPIIVNSTITGTNSKEIVDEAKFNVSEGFRTLKIKLAGNKIEDDLATVDALRKEVGGGVKLRLDANGKWSVEEAKEFVPRFDSFDIEFIEQPVRGAEQLAAVRHAVNAKIGVDEDLVSASDAEKLLRLKSADVFVVKTARTRGILQAVRIINLIRKHGAEPIVTSSLESGVGVTAAIHTASVLEDGGMACGLATGRLLADDLLIKPLPISEGCVSLSEEPGLGIELNSATARKYALDIRGCP